VTLPFAKPVYTASNINDLLSILLFNLLTPPTFALVTAYLPAVVWEEVSEKEEGRLVRSVEVKKIGRLLALL
jgi:hypothetical protein